MEGFSDTFLSKVLPLLIGLVVAWFSLKLFVRITGLVISALASGMLTFILYKPIRNFALNVVGPNLEHSTVEALQTLDPLWLSLTVVFLFSFVLTAIMISKFLKHST